MIYLILKILALFDLTVPGYSRDGPPCAIAKFAGVRYKPAWSKPPIRPDAQRFGLCLRWANKQHTESAMSAPNLNRGEAMSAIDKFRDLPGLVRRLVDDYLSAVKEAEALRQERDGLRDLIIKTMNSYVKEMEGYCYFGSNPGIDDDDIEEIADEIIAAMAKEQGDGN